MYGHKVDNCCSAKPFWVVKLEIRGLCFLFWFLSMLAKHLCYFDISVLTFSVQLKNMCMSSFRNGHESMAPYEDYEEEYITASIICESKTIRTTIY